MSTFRQDLLSVIDTVRSINGPSGLDLRTNQLTIRTKTWSGLQIGDGTLVSTVDLVLPAIYPIRTISQEQAIGAGGVYEAGDVMVDHITPWDGTSVGYTLNQLAPTISATNVYTYYVITGTHAGEYDVITVNTFRPFTYQLVLRRMRTTP